MLDYTKAAFGKIIGDFKKIFNGIKISTQILSIVYLICAVLTKTGIFVANLVLLTLAVGYFVFFLVMETKKGQRKIKKQVKNIYGWCKRLIKLLTISVTVYGLVVVKADFEPLSFLVLILMIFAWILEFLFYIIIKFLEVETKLLLDGMVADVEKLPFVGGFMMKKLTGKETEEEKPITKSRLLLDKLVGEAKAEKIRQKQRIKEDKKAEAVKAKAAKKQAKAERKSAKSKEK